MAKPTIVKKDMFKQECDECGKAVYGWTSDQVIYLLLQHKLSCDKKKEANENGK